mgnify:CR=1 FL=1
MVILELRYPLLEALKFWLFWENRKKESTIDCIKRSEAFGVGTKKERLSEIKFTYLF